MYSKMDVLKKSKGLIIWNRGNTIECKDNKEVKNLNAFGFDELGNYLYGSRI